MSSSFEAVRAITFSPWTEEMTLARILLEIVFKLIALHGGDLVRSAPLLGPAARCWARAVGNKLRN